MQRLVIRIWFIDYKMMFTVCGTVMPASDTASEAIHTQYQQENIFECDILVYFMVCNVKNIGNIGFKVHWFCLVLVQVTELVN